MKRNNTVLDWTRWYLFEIGCAWMMVAGWVILLPMAAFKLWHVSESLHYPGRMITAWNCRWIDMVWGNAEDGVTGAPFYMKRIPNERWRAYMWSAWRNSTNNMRWGGTLKGGPFFRHVGKKWIFQAGYRPDNGWPVLRLLRRP